MLALYSSRSFVPYRDAFASAQRVQLDGLKVFQQLTRLHLTLASDMLYHNLAGMQAMVRAATPADFLAQQDGLNAQFVEQVNAHTQQFVQGASEILDDASAAAETAQEDIEESAQHFADESDESAQSVELSAEDIGESTITPYEAEEIMKREAADEGSATPASPKRSKR